MKRISVLLIAVIIFTSADAQKKKPGISIRRVDPTNWWTGMKNPELQLMVYGEGVSTLEYSVSYPGVTLLKTNKVENPNFVFLDLNISAATSPGTFKITGKAGKTTLTWPYELKARTSEPKGMGVSQADFIYLIMPDRFANGDPTNDKLANLDKDADRNNPFLRHGGDLKGVSDHLDYLQDLGVTSVWLTPIIENDESQKKEGHGQFQSGYHGYHFTDFYKIDSRFGGNEAYVQFSKAVHQRGMKLVQDAVYNHVSDDHWLFKDRPSKDWFNDWPAYTGSSHKEQSLYDPHGAEIDRKVMVDGWFTPFLPDVNQRNPFFANYLIQNAIWCTEMFSVDAWRIDTYKYNDQEFMNRCNQALIDEYPNIHLFGETMTGNVISVSYFVRNNVNYPFKSNLPGTLDFPVNFAALDALRQKFGWDEGVNRLYNILTQDVLYLDPSKNVTSLDNHDLDRFYSVVGEDFAKFKIGITWLLTLRGIPSMYYGTEILMKNFKNPTDAEVRRDFPGGFPGDPQDKFTSAGRTTQENEAFDYVRKLAAYRRATSALNSGKTTQYIPSDGVYVYFRSNPEKTVMIVTNSMDLEKKLDTTRFAESIGNHSGTRNVITGETGSLSSLVVPAKTALVLELTR